MGIPTSVKISWVGAKYSIKLEQTLIPLLGREGTFRRQGWIYVEPTVTAAAPLIWRAELRDAVLP